LLFAWSLQLKEYCLLELLSTAPCPLPKKKKPTNQQTNQKHTSQERMRENEKQNVECVAIPSIPTPQKYNIF